MRMANNVPVSEQETTISFGRDNETCSVWTSDRTLMTKLDKLYSRSQEHVADGKIWAVTYEIPKQLLSFRSKVKTKSCKETKRQLSDKQILALQAGRKKLVQKDVEINSVAGRLF